METISFWSFRDNEKRVDYLLKTFYKLLEKNKTVFLLDANVFSPELHYRVLGGDIVVKDEQFDCGLLDYLLYYQDFEQASDLLDEYVVVKDNFIFMGSCYSSITRSASSVLNVDWRKFFPIQSPSSGIALFLYLKNEIKKEYKPDYLLINTPPGVTDIGTCLNHFIADKTLCLFSPLINKDEKELLEYLKNIIRGKSTKYTEYIFDIKLLM